MPLIDGPLLRDKRKQAGYGFGRREEFANLLGVSASTLTNAETGKSPLDMSVIYAAVRVLAEHDVNVEADELLAERKLPKPREPKREDKTCTPTNPPPKPRPKTPNRPQGETESSVA